MLPTWALPTDRIFRVLKNKREREREQKRKSEKEKEKGGQRDRIETEQRERREERDRSVQDVHYFGIDLRAQNGRVLLYCCV